MRHRFNNTAVLLVALLTCQIRAYPAENDPAPRPVRRLPVSAGSGLPGPGVPVSNPEPIAGGGKAPATPTRRTLPVLRGAPVASPPFRAGLESTEKAFAWDAVEKTYEAKLGESTARFTFSLTNLSGAEVTITGAQASCGCTSAILPTTPWRIPAGADGVFDVTTDLRGKSGVLAKTVKVESSAGTRILHVTAVIPQGTGISGTDRERNTRFAAADRQAVFKNDCAGCHLRPAQGKMGQELYAAACAICHDAEPRATMVPNLLALNKPTDAAYWSAWISRGRTNSLMPAFALAEGGPLDEKQIQSLVSFLDGRPKQRTTAEKAGTPVKEPR